MITYRLHFSENSEILNMRLQKAKAAQPARVLCQGFPEFSANFKDIEQNIIWAKEVSPNDLVSDVKYWDEIHLIVHRPEDLLGLNFTLYSFVVIQPTSYKQKNSWLSVLKAIPKEILNDKVCCEFFPWDKERCELMTVQEIVGFLYELKFHFKDWEVTRRQGVNLWDWRISESFELEASKFKRNEYNQKIEMPKISVIIPTYNNKYFVSNVLRHLENQTVEKNVYEIILVDDGSSDQTFEYLLIGGLFKTLQLIYLYWPRSIQRKRGDKLYRAGLSRNLGVRNAKAENIVFLDSDMIVPNNFIEVTLQALQCNDIVQFPRYHIRQEFSRANTKYEEITDHQIYIEEEEYWKKFFEVEEWQKLEKHWKYTCTYGLAIRKSDFYAVGRFPHFYISYGFEDTELGYRLAKMGKKFHLQKLNLLHLTSYSLSEYQFSKKNRHKLLSRTAKLFFLNTLEIENFHHLEGFMHGENNFFLRLKTSLCSLGKSKSFHEMT